MRRARTGRRLRVTALGAGAVMVALLAPAGTAGADNNAAPAPGRNLSQQTAANLLAAMGGESYAYAKYDAYRQVATGPLAALWGRTADMELRQHFAHFAGAYGLAGTNKANLTAAVAGEAYETTDMYPTFAREAAAAGDQTASRLFTEIAADEAHHRALFAQALTAVNGGGGTVPAPPGAELVKVVVKITTLKPHTLQNLLTAMHGEALANAKYLTYSQAARAHGSLRVAELFAGTAKVELREHFATEANLAGLAGGSRANLLVAIGGETNEAKVVYPDAAQQAYLAGERVIGNLFRQTAHDESRHAATFASALRQLTLPDGTAVQVSQSGYRHGSGWVHWTCPLCNPPRDGTGNHWGWAL